MLNRSKSVIFMLISALAFAFMAANVRLAGNIPLCEKVFFRNLVSLIVAFFMIRKGKDKIIEKKENLKYLLLRSFLGLLGVVLYFYAINNLYLADSSMMNKLSPFFVTFFAWLFLKEKLSRFQIAALIIVFCSALLIIKPKLELSVLPAFAGFLSAMFAGAAYTLVRFLGNREKPATIVFFFSLVSVIVMFPLMMMKFKIPTFIQLIFLSGTGIFAAIGQFGLTLAYKYAKASEVAIYNYTNIIFSAIIGYFLWKEISDIWSIIGGMILISASAGIFVYNKNKK